MSVEFIVSQDVESYFAAVLFFLSGYWLAYIFKNLSLLVSSLGIFSLLLILCLFAAMLIATGTYITTLQNTLFSIAYGFGFFFRFFRHDY